MLRRGRKSLWRLLRRTALGYRIWRANGPLRIILGAGGTEYEGWLATDIDTLNILAGSDWCRYFRPASIDALLAEHVWEHLDREQGRIAAEYCFQYLNPEAYLRLAVPDGFHPQADYIEYVKVGGHGPGAADHKVLYDYHSMQLMLETVGFQVRLLEYFDAQGRFHATAWQSQDGPIERSMAHDPRNVDGQPNYTSLIVDAIKPAKGAK